MARAIDSEVAFRFLTEQLVKETGAFSKGVNKGLNIARSAMRNPDAIPTLTPPNDLLTIEELREMNGNPVYVVPLNEFYDLGKWCVLGVSPNEDYSCALVPGINDWVWRFKDYGKDWLAYRHPKEGEEET